MNIILICLAIKYKGDWDAIYNALEAKERVTFDETMKVEKMIKEDKVNIITILDREYPNQLKAAYKPPFVIWLKGDIKLLNNKFLCAAGNQEDDYSKKRIDEFIPEIEKSYLVINPNFKGLDNEIINKTKNSMVYVSACGNNLSDVNKDNVLLISEYPDGTKPHKDHFRNRNRIIASLSENLILFTSKKDGPINHLVSAFLNLGKEIFCFPGNGDQNDGNSELIKQGANLITSIKDISN